ncbi:MAG: hypothetical protein MZV64_64785 [Ignavibacteriales bacterium]|nr:hypothetical protein [Ignavibacteriales bacterium]
MSYKDYDTLKNWLSKKNFQKRIDNLSKKYKDKNIVIYGAGILASVALENYNFSNLSILGFADQKVF